ncbi:MAG: alpha/beta hydrolase [Flavobacteriales bacterium]|nr:alpha/beta hydrolase [Flavobacteriales bacterium]|tara:strand:+ start:319 stop:1086 length:768 start_codon:yes stop_codon:yes gene_type:complete
MKLFSRIYGEGKPLIILHGLFGMSDNWNALGKKFADHYNVHILDLRNHGRSPHADDFSYRDLSDDLLEYIDSNKLSSPIIMGHSLGGKVALNFAFAHSSKLSKVIVLDIAPKVYQTDFHKKILNILINLPLYKFQKRLEVDSYLADFIEDQSLRSFLLKNLKRGGDDKYEWRFNIDALYAKLDNIKEANFLRGTLSIPVVFVKSENSDYIMKEDIQLINKHFSNYEMITMKNVGHWLHAENPLEFYKLICDKCLN